MPVCANTSWDMELTVESSGFDNFFTFDVTVINETISGWVRDTDGNRTELSGRCHPVSSNGQREVSLMDFRFIAKGQNGDVEVFMSGAGFQPDPASSKPIFRGGFIAVVPTSGASVLPVQIDEGDTGTGSGQQT